MGGVWPALGRRPGAGLAQADSGYQRLGGTLGKCSKPDCISAWHLFALQRVPRDAAMHEAPRAGRGLGSGAACRPRTPAKVAGLESG